MSESAATSPTPPTVLLEVANGIATVTLNRPQAMNSLDVSAKVRLREILQRIAADPAVRCVVLTGTGRAFCTGQDLKEHIGLLEQGDAEVLSGTVVEHYNPIVTALAEMPKPVIAAINGIAAGAGASLAMACDFRILRSDGGFNLAFANVALSCDTGASVHLPHLVGRAKAIELLYFPRTVPAAECLDLGLVTSVVDPAEFTEQVDALATRLAAGPTTAYGAMRRSVLESSGRDLAGALAFEARMMRETGATDDHRAAVAAFVAKERPHFTGR